jgi:hypothetical protein
MHVIILSLFLWLFNDALSTETIQHEMMEWELAGETEILGENLTECHFIHTNVT